MKYFILTFCALMLSIMTASATPIPAEKGPQYYAGCMKGAQPNLLPGSQDAFCKCTQNYMMQNMSYEDLVALAKNDIAAQNKMIIGVYSPCLEIPVHDDTYLTCKQQKNIPDATCQCLSNGLANFTKNQAQQLLTKVLAQYPRANDPLAIIKQTPEFEAQEKQIAQQCSK